jgi:sulfite exporter TauE/SafE
MPGSERFAASVAWQGARIAAYTVAGALLGAFGERAGMLLSIATSPWLPWALALLLVASAFQWTVHLRRVPGFSGASRRLVSLGTGGSPSTVAAVWGFVTPLLPCGFLYGALATSLVAGSAVAGAVVTAAFGVGTMPALVAAQAPLGLEKRLPDGWGAFLRQAVPLTTAAVLVWRALHAAPESCCPR